ncbi:hypothetical protein quinque_005275 [Culex quinquefasciatus]
MVTRAAGVALYTQPLIPYSTSSSDNAADDAHTMAGLKPNIYALLVTCLGFLCLVISATARIEDTLVRGKSARF